ncbi:hypothetical protein BC833DRAFT_576259 [Globomyces pollinis-pini]|nr:hypothetical protein BC833DRAFT_576259 [Globomyces pollinis-pini]
MNNLPPREFYTIVGGGVLLAANAGFINVVSMAGIFPGVTVSHVTGSVSRVAISIMQEDLETFVLVVSILLSFMFGCFMAGFIVGDHRFTLGAPYGFCLAIESGALFASFLFLREEYILGEWCAAFACGLQNAMVTSFSGMAIRTTHMTGLVTDIGNIIGQACRTDSKAELWRLKVHIPIFCGFLFGGFCGELGWIYLREYSLLVPCFFTGGVGVLYLSLPFIKEATHKLKEATSMSNLANIGANLGIPGIEKPEKYRGPVNPALDGYKTKLDDDMKHFLADIGDDQAEVVEMQPAVQKSRPY